MKPKVLVGLSGGVDSSMSAMMLQKMGYEVEGVYMKLHSVSEDYHKQNLEAVAKVANFLGIKYHILDIEDTFKQQVYDYFVQSYRDGITPNPCVVCNRLIKFGAMVDFARSLGMDKVATGHYAKTDGKFIYCADDQSKDQSYFLAQVDKSVIPMLIFPMSNYKKEEIISMASKMPSFKSIAQKKESQEICFVPTVYTDILSKHFDTDKDGDVIKEGKVVGKHKGYMHYTIGKRRGFSVHGAHDPHFVLSTNPKDNTITVGTKEQLAVNSVVLSSLNMFIDDLEFDAVVKLRYRSSGVPCHVVIKDSKAKVTLKEPVYGVAMGQYGVFYMGDKVVGSGDIVGANN
ncbi:MAG: tRNA 2-thiouridine(34) synthase MnmA [Arcobacteraceae bacterium]|nr:tRNA 2-thiouridine(34) synthase MnmA [Arcobacteraceae bacterium]